MAKPVQSPRWRDAIDVLVRRFAALACMTLATMVHGAVGSESPHPSRDVDGFIPVLEHLRREASIPGLSFAVVRDRQIVTTGGLGHAHLGSKLSANAETPYDIASVAKPLSAVAILTLVESDVVDLDRRIAEVSDWADFARHSLANRPSSRETCTAATILTRSGTCSRIRPRKPPERRSPTTRFSFPGRRGRSWP